MRVCILMLLLILPSCSYTKIVYDKKELINEHSGIIIGGLDGYITDIKDTNDVERAKQVSPGEYSKNLWINNSNAYKKVKASLCAESEGIFSKVHNRCVGDIYGLPVPTPGLQCYFHQGTKEKPQIALFYLEPGEIIYIGSMSNEPKTGDILQAKVIDEYDNLIKYLQKSQPNIVPLIKKRLFKFVDRPKECQSYTIDYTPTKEQMETCRIKLIELYGDKKF